MINELQDLIGNEIFQQNFSNSFDEKFYRRQNKFFFRKTYFLKLLKIQVIFFMNKTI